MEAGKQLLSGRQNPLCCFTQAEWAAKLGLGVVVGRGAGQGEEPNLSQPSVDGNHRVSARFPWILFSTPRLKISPQGRTKRKLCGRLCYVSRWLFSIEVGSWAQCSLRCLYSKSKILVLLKAIASLRWPQEGCNFILASRCFRKCTEILGTEKGKVKNKDFSSESHS